MVVVAKQQSASYGERIHKTIVQKIVLKYRAGITTDASRSIKALDISVQYT